MRDVQARAGVRGSRFLCSLYQLTEQGEQVNNSQNKQGTAINLDQLQNRLEHIKRNMPKTYELIVEKAKLQGNAVYRAVRLGCLGEPNRFWAMEAGHFAGTAFDMRSVQDEVAWQMVNFGDDWAIAFDMALDGGRPSAGALAVGGADGAN